MAQIAPNNLNDLGHNKLLDTTDHVIKTLKKTHQTFRFGLSVEEKLRFIIIFSSLLSILCLENLVPVVGRVSH